LPKIAKESIEIVFENIMAGKSKTIEEAMKNASIQSVNDDDLERIIEEIVDKNEEIIKNQKERAVGPLMGIAMKELRGKASGETINNLLLTNIKKKIENL
jgi:glutamyl-tRNA(Gln) amidotransferase subunit E